MSRVRLALAGAMYWLSEVCWEGATVFENVGDALAPAVEYSPTEQMMYGTGNGHEAHVQLGAEE